MFALEMEVYFKTGNNRDTWWRCYMRRISRRKRLASSTIPLICLIQSNHRFYLGFITLRKEGTWHLTGTLLYCLVLYTMYISALFKAYCTVTTNPILMNKYTIEDGSIYDLTRNWALMCFYYSLTWAASCPVLSSHPKKKKVDFTGPPPWL